MNTVSPYFLVISICASSLLVLAARSGDTVCVSITIPLCRGLPYNTAKLPSGSRAQLFAKRSLDMYEQLISSSCSPVLVYFLCAFHLPMCQPGFEEPIKPCRELCERVESDCNSTIQLGRPYKHDWPQKISCDKLPSYHSGICSQPSSFLSKKHKRIECNNPIHGFDFHFYRKQAYKFVIKADVTAITNRNNGTWRIQVDAVRIIKHGEIHLNKSSFQIWSNATCLCPALEENKRYIIGGHEDVLGGHLVLLDNGLVLPDKRKWLTNVTRWEKRILRRKKKKSRRLIRETRT